MDISRSRVELGDSGITEVAEALTAKRGVIGGGIRNLLVNNRQELEESKAEINGERLDAKFRVKFIY